MARKALICGARQGLPTHCVGTFEPHVLHSLESWTGKLDWAGEAERAAPIGGSGLRGRFFRAFQRFLVPPRGKRFVLQRSAEHQSWHQRVADPAFWSGYWQSRFYFEDAQAEVRSSLVFRAELSPDLRQLHPSSWERIPV